MNRYLLRVLVSVLFITISASVFSQVKLFDSGDTKIYDNGTRITYFEMEDFPNTAEIREFVTKSVLEHPDVKRVYIYKNGTTFMYDAAKEVEPDMIVDAINEALAEYISEGGTINGEKIDFGKPASTSVQPVDRRTAIEEAAPAEPASFEVVPVERPNSSRSGKSNSNVKTK